MCRYWEGDEERLEWKRLIVWTSEEEVGFGGGNGSREEGYEGGICYVERSEDCESIGGVFL